MQIVYLLTKKSLSIRPMNPTSLGSKSPTSRSCPQRPQRQITQITWSLGFWVRITGKSQWRTFLNPHHDFREVIDASKVEFWCEHTQNQSCFEQNKTKKKEEERENDVFRWVKVVNVTMKGTLISLK